MEYDPEPPVMISFPAVTTVTIADDACDDTRLDPVTDNETASVINIIYYIRKKIIAINFIPRKPNN
jgi:hypothetical protein